MRIAIYSPYLDTLGGGERYMMTIAQILSRHNLADVLLDANLFLLDKAGLKKNLSERFGLDLSNVNFIRAPIGQNSIFFYRALFLKRYDLLFYLTDGSIFYPTAKKNILHIQTPLTGQPATSFLGKVKLKGWDLIMYNSKFTQAYSEKKWPLKSKVIYPPVDVEKIKPLKKKSYILSVGRFFGFLKDKKHEFLIDVFKDLFRSGKIKGWSLYLVGGLSEGDKTYLENLKKLAQDFPINFYPNLPYKDLNKLYGESSIYWHAAGFGEDDPTKMEHFGISTVEAMAGGCAPVVIAKGGQTEIVKDRESGLLWDDSEEFKKLTLKVINDTNLRDFLKKNAIKRAQIFSKEIFAQKILDLVEK